MNYRKIATSLLLCCLAWPCLGDPGILDHTPVEAMPSRGKTVDFVGGVAFSPDRKTYATLSGRSVKFYNAQTAEKRLVVEPEEVDGGLYRLICYSRDGRTVAIGPIQHDGIGLLDSTTGKSRLTLESPPRERHDLVSSLAYSPDNKTVAAGFLNGEVVLWDAETGKRRVVLAPRILPPHSKVFPRADVPIPARVIQLAFIGDGTTLLSNARGTTVRAFNVADGVERETPIRISTSGYMSLSPDGNSLAIMEQASPEIERDDPGGAGTDYNTQRVTLWDGPSWRKRGEWIAPHYASDFALLAGGQALVWVEADKREVNVRDAKDGRVLSSIPLECKGEHVALSHDGRMIALFGIHNLPQPGACHLVELDGTTLRLWKPKR